MATGMSFGTIEQQEASVPSTALIRTLDEWRKTQKRTDLIFACKDGTNYHVHKMVVFTATDMFEAALRHQARDDQQVSSQPAVTDRYCPPEGIDSATVGSALGLIYGQKLFTLAPWDSSKIRFHGLNDTFLEPEAAVLQLAKVYALFDEWLADNARHHCLVLLEQMLHHLEQKSAFSLMKALEYLVKNSYKRQLFLELLIYKYFSMSADRVRTKLLPNDERLSHLDIRNVLSLSAMAAARPDLPKVIEEDYLDWFAAQDIDLSEKLIREILDRHAPSFSLARQKDSFKTACRDLDFAQGVVDIWCEPKNYLDLKVVFSNEACKEVMKETGLLDDVFEKLVSNARIHGATYTCHECWHEVPLAVEEGSLCSVASRNSISNMLAVKSGLMDLVLQWTPRWIRNMIQDLANKIMQLEAIKQKNTGEW